jgi:hypothetical protein
MFPILGLVLALNWMQHDVRLAKIGRYILYKIEPKLPGVNWETFYQTQLKSKKINLYRVTLWSTMGLFLILDILAMVIGYYDISVRDTLPFLKVGRAVEISGCTQDIIIVIDFIAIIFTFLVLIVPRLLVGRSFKSDEKDMNEDTHNMANSAKA